MIFPYVHFDGATGQIKQLSSSAYKVGDYECAEILDQPESLIKGFTPENASEGWLVDLTTVDMGTCHLKKAN